MPLCDVCYTPLVPEDSGDNYAYCVRCGDSKKLCDYSGEMLTIKETITLVKAEKEIMGEETEEEKEIFPRYGVYWRKKGEHYEALCPECKKALNIFGGKKQVSLTNLFCPECKKVRPLYIGDGIPITIHKAVELLMTEKPEVKPECEEDVIKARLDSLDEKVISLNAEIVDAVRAVRGITDTIRLAKNDIQSEITTGNIVILKTLDISAKELQALYLPIASSTQNKVAGAALLTCAFLLGGIITFAIIHFLNL